MVKTIYYNVTKLRCTLGFKLVLLILIAFPLAALSQTRSELNRDSEVNGYKLTRSTRDTEVRLIGVHTEIRKSGPLLNGRQQVTLTLDNGTKIRRMVMFKNGTAVIGRIPNGRGSVVSAVCPCLK